jgi:effector-binding domain-containing protein
MVRMAVAFVAAEVHDRHAPEHRHAPASVRAMGGMVMGYTIETRHQGRQPYVAVRATVRMAEIGAVMGTLFGRLYGWLGAAGITPAGPPWTRYLSVGADEVELEVAAPLTAAPFAVSPAADRDLVTGILPACEVASTIHVGTYDGLTAAYAAVTAWLHEHGALVSGAMWEAYLSDPQTEPDPARWQTLVCYPYSPA